MLNSIEIGRYYPVPSRVHELNPASKIIAILLFIFMSLLCTHLFYMIILMLFLLCILKETNVPLSYYFRALKGIWILLVFVFLIQFLFGTSFLVSILSVMRLVMIVLVTAVLTLTTRPMDITSGLEQVCKPLEWLGIPSKKMALSITLAFRFIPTIIDQSKKVLKSLASRGLHYQDMSLKDKIMSLKMILVPMFHLTMKRADDLADAMEVRLFRIRASRTNYKQNEWGVSDTCVILIHVLLFIVIIVKEVIG